MDSKNYERQVELHCPTCGGTQFDYDKKNDSDEQIIKCHQCNRETTKRVLIEENSNNIRTHADEIKKEVIKDAKEELSKSLRKIFK